MGSRIRFTRAKQVFDTYPELSETVREPRSDVTPQDYVLELQEGDDPFAALAYFAHVLPKREAVWWGYNCVAGLDGGASEQERTVLSLTEIWVRDGDEEARTAVREAAEAARKDSASAWIGLAAGWSGGSLSPNPDYRVEVPEDLTAKAVNAAVLFAVCGQEPETRQEAVKSCLAAGLSFAEGGKMPVVSVKGRAPASS
ncbi:DUF6931 family protein [Roseibium sp.]|uniref:DUF6931 family protein n=1 Tax=Roseibium sp. TaxID=1936156 RepID=UPI003D0B85BE